MVGPENNSNPTEDRNFNDSLNFTLGDPFFIDLTF